MTGMDATNRRKHGELLTLVDMRQRMIAYVAKKEGKGFPAAEAFVDGNWNNADEMALRTAPIAEIGLRNAERSGRLAEYMAMRNRITSMNEESDEYSAEAIADASKKDSILTAGINKKSALAAKFLEQK